MQTRLLVPLLFASAVLGQSPDLIVRDIDRTGLTGDWQILEVGGTVSAAVRNIGTGASAACALVFFEDSNRNGGYDPGIDRVFATGAVPAIAAGAQAVVSATFAGTVRFRDDLLFAMVDPGNVVAETSETNNVWDTGRQCDFRPQPGPLTPTLEWSWTSTAVDPNALNVPCTPCVADLTGDGFPEVIFQSTSDTSGNNVPIGPLRVLDGRTGAELFNVTNPAWQTTASFSPAVADIDGDGLPEIVTGAAGATRLICFEHDGTFKWLSDTLQFYNIANCEIADLDGDGTPEIVVGRQALDNLGQLLWTGTGGRGGAYGPCAVVVDVDLDGTVEIIAGHTIYTPTGAIETTLVGRSDGFAGVANFDADPQGEIVLVDGGSVYLYEHDGTLIWGPRAIPGGGQGGAPTIADYDGDGLPEIGVAGASRYAVFEHDGTLKWQAVTQDVSSNATGSSVFDFEGDGSAEVIYRDELFLRVFRGSDGTVLWSVPMSSCTWHEYVLVADVDGDGNAEILTGANNNCGFGPQRGMFAYGDALDRWVATRKLWNQFNYHITNINDDLTVPAVPQLNWLVPAGQPYNNFRQNIFTGGAATAAPDLTASSMVLPCIGSSSAVVRVGNGGAIFAPAGVQVSFYDGDPQGAGVLVGTAATTMALQPGDFEDVTLAVAVSLTGPVFAVVDPNSAVSECDETNNAHSVPVCTATATAGNYGSGWPGTNGVPGIGLDGPPSLGATRTLTIAGSSGVPSFGCFFFGLAQANTATGYGGTILVDPLIEYAYPVPAGPGSYSFQVQCRPEFCGWTIYAQAIQLDVGATHWVAFTRGLRIAYGQ